MALNNVAWKGGFKQLRGDASNPTFGIGVHDASLSCHIFDPADAGLDWNVSADSDPTLYIHCSGSNAPTDYIKLWHDDTDANIQAYGATQLTLGLAGTEYLKINATRTTYSHSYAAGNLTDGYGAFEVDVTFTGTMAGHCAALSAWANLTSGTTGSNMVCAQTNGIYEAAGVTPTSSIYIFGMRSSAIMGDSSGWTVLAPFSLNTGNTAITCLFHTASAPAIGYAASSPSSSACGTVPLFCDVDGSDVRYIHVYPDAN